MITTVYMAEMASMQASHVQCTISTQETYIIVGRQQLVANTIGA
jgi:hypothetical protein